MKYVGIITDTARGYSYKTAFVNSKNLARKLAHDFVNRKNIDCATIDVIQAHVMG
jgi:hypothetical protein